MRRTGLLLGVVVLVAVAGTAVAHATTRIPLERTNWVLTSRSELGTPLGDVSVSAVFDGGHVEGNAACNSYGAPYTVRGRRMTIGPAQHTLVGCPGAQGAVEQAYLARLPRVASYRISGTTLTLRDRAGRQLLVYRASIGRRALAGGWNATSYYTGDAVQSPVPGSALTLQFADNRVSGNGGCNTFDGPAKASGVDRIALGPLRSTLTACADPAFDAQERQYLHALELAVRYRVTGSTLTLFRPGGTIAATFERALGLTSGT